MSDYNVASGAKDSIQKLIATKTSLTQARDTAISQLQSAKDDAEVQKLGVTVASLNAAIAGVDASIQQAVATANLQEQKNQAAERIYHGNVTVQSTQSLGGEVNSGLSILDNLTGEMSPAPKWQGQN